MTMEEICADMAAKASAIDPIGKSSMFYLDDERTPIDGSGDGDVVTLVSGEDVKADCAVRMSLDNCGKLRRNEIKPFMAVASGKIKVKGDFSITSKLKKST